MNPINGPIGAVILQNTQSNQHASEVLEGFLQGWHGACNKEGAR
jgi:hypothetical protein